MLSPKVIVGEEPIALEAGEVIVFTKSAPHVLSSSPGMRADPCAPSALDAVAESQLPFFINYGGDGPVSAKLVCGYLACDAQPFNPLLENLPPVIKAGDPKGGDAGWLGQFIRLTMMESADKRAGGESILAKLSELMFIEVVRRYLETLPPEQAGWLAGLRDPLVGKALSLMHASAARNWTIEALAKEVGLSRSVLAERFADLDADRLGAPERRQHQYCNRCRRSRLRIRGGVQPCLQEAGRRAALGLASPPRA